MVRDTRREVLLFWFNETQPAQWFQKNPAFDDLIRTRFLMSYEMAAGGLCDSWKDDAKGCLALCILLDQMPRNMFRDTPRAFATDEKALLVARHAVARGFDALLTPVERTFLYLPYEHSEEITDQKKSVALFETIKNEEPLAYDYALRHYEVIDKFGRFPHRNKILGRESTPEELVYLADPAAGF